MYKDGVYVLVFVIAPFWFSPLGDHFSRSGYTTVDGSGAAFDLGIDIERYSGLILCWLFQ